MAKAKQDPNFDDLPALDRPRDKAWSNWAKFEKEGESVSGYVRDVFYRAEEKSPDGTVAFQAQRGITLEQSSGELINVAIKRMAFVLAKTDHLRLGDPLTMEYEKTLAPRQKGYKGAKQFAFYGKNLPENEGNKTVKQLEEEDMKAQEVAPNVDLEKPEVEADPLEIGFE